MFCRLCLIETITVNSYINIFTDQNIVAIITQHLSFQPELDEQSIICKDCCQILEDFHTFYTRIHDTQKRFVNEILIKPEVLKFEENNTDDEVQILQSLTDNIANENDEVPPSKDCEEAVLSSELDQDFIPTHNNDDEENADEPEVLEEDNADEPEVLDEENADEPEVLEEENSDEPEVLDENRLCLRNGKNMKKRLSIRLQKNIESKSKNKKSSDDIDQKILNFMKLRCDICLLEEDTFTEIKRHFRTVHNMLGYIICCDKKFTKRVYLSDHVDIHVNPEKFKCKICNRVQPSKNSLRQHIKIIHETQRKWECDVCHKKSANRSALELHKYTHVPIEMHRFKCTDCEKTFASEYQMKMHWSKVHESLANNICHVCGKIIKDVILFKKHQLEHEGIIEPKVQCEKCGIWLKNLLSLRKHVRNLHAEAHIDHICNICDKVCRSKGSLTSHKFYVHSSRTYPCNICGKEFKKTITLREHMTTHTGEVLYTCPHCPKTFTSNANLHHHRKKNHRKEWDEKRTSKLQPPVHAINNNENLE